MKKIFLILLLLPLSISARENITTELKCETNNLKINDYINCDLIINNPSKITFNSISFDSNNKLENIKTDPNFTLSTQNYKIYLNSNNETMNVLNFDVKMTNNNFNLNLNNIYLNLHAVTDLTQNDINQDFKIENDAYLTKILIDNQPLSKFDSHTYEYTEDIYAKDKYLEVKVEACPECEVDKKFQLVSTTENEITLEVTNKNNLTKYKINLNYIENDANLLTSVKINEINFEFNPRKFNYYFEVNNNINNLNFIFSESEIYSISSTKLNIGNNLITIKNKMNNIIYNFNIKRLTETETVNDEAKLKVLKIGNKYVNLKEDVYSYNVDKTDNFKVTLETTIENQDYDIAYNENNIIITIFGLNGENSKYTINFQEEEPTNVEVDEYDNTSNIIIVCIFAALFVLIALIAANKYREYRKNF